MSLNIYLEELVVSPVFRANYTHNAVGMVEAAGIYTHVWRPEELDITKASELIEPLRGAIERMKADPNRFISLNPPNGWGSYDTFLPWLEQYLEACEEHPDATVRASR
jgi:hypothetical protein